MVSTSSPLAALTAALLFGVAAAFRHAAPGKSTETKTASTTWLETLMKGADTTPTINASGGGLMNPGPDPPLPPEGMANIMLELKFDSYPGDISVELSSLCGDGKVLGEAGPFDDRALANTVLTEMEPRVDGLFEFTIFDSYGDGLCCGEHRDGGYTLTYTRSNGTVEKFTSKFEEIPPGSRNAKMESTVFGSLEYCPVEKFGVAEYDDKLKVPACKKIDPTVPICSTDGTGLLNCKKASGEPNGPNTLDGCMDGAGGTCGTDESIENIGIVAIKELDVNSDVSDGPLTAGGFAGIGVKVVVFDDGSQDQVDFFHTSNPGPTAEWTHIGSVIPNPTVNNDVQTDGEFVYVPMAVTLSDAPMQAVRVNMRWVGSGPVDPQSCSAGEYDDVDDLAFAVAPGCEDLQEGFECGMATELTGLWAGDEKYYYDGVLYDYCTRAMFNPANGKNFLTWNGGYLGVGGEGEPESCKDVGVDTLAKTINGSWLPLLVPSEAFILEIEQRKCLDVTYCDYDVTENFPGYTAIAKACGTHLKKDSFRPDEFSCEHYLTTLMEDQSGKKELAVVLSYWTYSGGYNNYTCPTKPTFSEAVLESDPYMQGNTLFVLQANDLTNSTDYTNWDCLV